VSEVSKKYNLLVPDDLHVNQRNFASFFKFIEKNSIPVKFVKDRRDWVALYGNYESKSQSLSERARVLSYLDSERLFNYTIKGVNLFKISRAEILSRVMTNSHWYDESMPLSRKDVFEKILLNNKQILMQCLAAAWDWIDYWSILLADEKEFTHCCVFSGSLIYQRSLVELLRYTPTKVLHMESFFTGNDYYCEERYSPIANDCDIRHQAVFDALASSDTGGELDRERMKAINKIILAKNKNVIQPEFGEKLVFHFDAPVVSILGQVVNDFSLLEYNGIGLSSIAFYKKIIRDLVCNGYNVVFKAHPWEEQKTNVGKSFTKDVLLDFVNDFLEDERDRVKIVDHYPIDKLFDISSFVLGLNSQSLIEAAFNGLKPVQFGNAFFGEKGFTHDFSLNSCEDFILKMKSGEISGSLNLDEYRVFEEFLRRLMQGQLISIHDSGVARLNSVFEIPSIIGLAKNAPLVQPAVVKENVVVEKAIGTNPTEEAVGVVVSSSLNVKIIEPGFKNDTPAKRKFRKFMNNPRKFCADSNVAAVKALRHLF